jgi:hypothetical protein
VGGLAALSYVALLEPLQRAARANARLYPPDSNGHPLVGGYNLIAQELAKALKAKIKPLPSGLLLLKTLDAKNRYYLNCMGALWYVPLP